MQYRRSRQRERILELLRNTTEHPTADWLYRELKKEIPGLSMGTVYRNLRILEEQGAIRKLPAGSTFDRFDADRSPHSHLICERCGRICDVRLPREANLDSDAERESGFTVTRHRIEFFGLCRSCQAHTTRTT
jgi:Fe2+ or Zn2+ uptake regulation protein